MHMLANALTRNPFRVASAAIRIADARPLRLLVIVLAALACGACATLRQDQGEPAAMLAEASRQEDITCQPASPCTRSSPLLDLATRAAATSGPQKSKHHALILDDARDALMARLDLLRGAKHSIDLQTYIFDEDDIGQLMLAELRAAARRGVQVRLLVDQLSAFKHVRTLAAIASDHKNLELRLYNPVRGKGRAGYRDMVAALLCCFRQTNQRMHAKVLVVDGMVAITGGRNYQDDYFDWSDEYNFRDRDVLVAGPEVINAHYSFERLWQSRLSVPAERLHDVGRFLNKHGAPAMPEPKYVHPERIEEAINSASDARLVASRLADHAIPVEGVRFLSDGPGKHDEQLGMAAISGMWQQWARLFADARHEVILQTPYLVLSDDTRDRLRQQRGLAPPQVIVSTSSLASTDSVVVYALTHKFKRSYSDKLGFHIHEYRPHKAGAAAGEARRRLHAKSMAIDGRLGVIGTHNFDARSDHYNIESMLVIEDTRFAQLLGQSIRDDIHPVNSWMLRPESPAMSVAGPGLSPERRGSTSASAYEWVPGPGCVDAALQPGQLLDPCYRPVGDFPESGAGRKILARILSVLGKKLVPLL